MQEWSRPVDRVQLRSNPRKSTLGGLDEVEPTSALDKSAEYNPLSGGIFADPLTGQARRNGDAGWKVDASDHVPFVRGLDGSYEMEDTALCGGHQQVQLVVSRVYSTAEEHWVAGHLAWMLNSDGFRGLPTILPGVRWLLDRPLNAV